MTEYYLQKKTLAGWSNITWYLDLEQARKNYIACVGNGNSGYSWRLVEGKVIECAMLEEVTDIAPPSPQPVPGKEILTGWGEPSLIPPNRTSVNPGWADIPSSSQAVHGLSGSVWVIHHQLRQKSRIPGSELQKHLDNGFERCGPRTQFKEGGGW